MAHPQIAIFARMAGENAKPTRVLAGQKTLLSRTMHDVRYDEIHDELYVNNPFAAAILVFRGGATGEEAPIRIIQGPHTQLTSGGADRLDIDPIHNEIFVPGRTLRVFRREATGDATPIRVIAGPDTQLRGVDSVAVDTVHDIIAMGGGSGGSGGEEGGIPLDKWGDPTFTPPMTGKIVIFGRSDSGNAKPRAVIVGPKTGITRILQLQIYSPKGWIVAAQPGRPDLEEPPGIYVGVWSIHDNGDVPARWKLAGPKTTLKKPRGVVLDPKHKEMIIADMRLNAVLTYYFPELF